MKNWFFIGIGGCGMAALAKIYMEKGYQVSGSDLNTSPTIEQLRNQGAKVFIGHSAEHITDEIDLVVVSTAITSDNPEMLSAERAHIPIVHRSVVLQWLTEEKRSINIAGSHGKTTTSSMLASILLQAGKKPTCVVGGTMAQLGGNGIFGMGDYMVAEADESDGSFLNLKTHMALVTNIDDDHLDFYKNKDRLVSAFRKFLSQVSIEGIIVLGTDCPVVEALAGEYPSSIRFALHKEADYQARNVRYESGKQIFDVYYLHTKLSSIAIHMPGEYNVLNALGAFVCAHLLGIDAQDIKEYFLNYEGVGRRFQNKGTVRGRTVIDDYAHHPSEIRSLLLGAREIGFDRIISVFQPHRYTRTSQFMDEFGKVLTLCDHAYVSDIYAAGEEPIEGVTSEELVRHAHSSQLEYKSLLSDIGNALAKETKENDLILTIGAGNITDFGEAWLRYFQMKGKTVCDPKMVSLKPFNSWGVGGYASLFYEPKNRKELIDISQVLQDFTVVGNGTNILFPDGWLKTGLIHISNAFSSVTVDQEIITAQTGIALSSLAKIAMDHHLSGLEEFYHIPGTLGGGLYMNAGTHQASLMDMVTEITYLKKGVVYTMTQDEFHYGYRTSQFMKSPDIILLSATMQLKKMDADIIRDNIDQAARVRSHQPKGKSAGSTFKNPPHESAGRLIEACGLKGFQIGGAQISSIHANFIINNGGATSQDIINVIEYCEREVYHKFGVRLELEIRKIKA